MRCQHTDVHQTRASRRTIYFQFLNIGCVEDVEKRTDTCATPERTTARWSHSSELSEDERPHPVESRSREPEEMDNRSKQGGAINRELLQ